MEIDTNLIDTILLHPAASQLVNLCTQFEMGRGLQRQNCSKAAMFAVQVAALSGQAKTS